MWYGVCLLYRSEVDGRRDDECTWEEFVVLIEADDKEAAKWEGERIGKAGEHEYITATDELLRWVFDRVLSVYEILEDGIRSGTEIYSMFLRTSEAQSLLKPFDNP
jgi:hypothetical protein